MLYNPRTRKSCCFATEAFKLFEIICITNLLLQYFSCASLNWIEIQRISKLVPVTATMEYVIWMRYPDLVWILQIYRITHSYPNDDSDGSTRLLNGCCHQSLCVCACWTNPTSTGIFWAERGIDWEIRNAKLWTQMAQHTDLEQRIRIAKYTMTEVARCAF